MYRIPQIFGSATCWSAPAWRDVFPPATRWPGSATWVMIPGEPFATVSAAPVAQLQRSRHFLLLFPPEPALEVSRGRWHPDLDPVAIESARRLGELLLPPEDDTEEDN